MNIINFLEQLACSAHHKAVIQEMLCKQPVEVQEVFMANNAMQFKKILSGSEFFADRTLVVQLLRLKFISYVKRLSCPCWLWD